VREAAISIFMSKWPTIQTCRTAHLAVRRALYRRLGERKVDLLVRPRTREPSPMEVIARRTGVSARTMSPSPQAP